MKFSWLLLPALLLSTSLSATETAIQAAVEHSSRTAANKARDHYRNPVETLSFFEVAPHSTVVEISPGAGWYTEILAPLLHQQGTLYAAHFPANSSSEFAQRSRASFAEKMASHPVYSKVQMTEFAPVASIQIAPDASADVVLTFRNLHNWYMQGGEDAMRIAFNHFYRALKPGGVLGVVEHRLPEAKRDSDWTQSGYFPQSLAIELAEQAGFVFEASSEINANPRDTADHPRGVWTLPPSLRLGEQDRDRYLAIGESDRMTLKFRKPQQQ
ncbi:methyltransferase domain-containing protein [Alkalimonas sp. MEB108]|uniref:Methyltransferase domain-containing protein n=1 Tax=Alkalimonas cellulosilytica TaxID=3058395 RepID=A0ABU7J3C3_9GAMM|nr:methyltransferase domain-containing protein [Alkalimonas sp. MEB108]MEE2001001.1 methyltransferase domain-containing protein [Alkalimonas sp. MEB108]